MDASENIKFDYSCTYLNRSVKISTEIDFGRERTRPLGLLARAQKYLPEAGRRIKEIRKVQIQNARGDTFQKRRSHLGKTPASVCNSPVDDLIPKPVCLVAN